MSQTPRFSIAICSYNPNPISLTRLLLAINQIIKTTQEEIAIVIIDNNSVPALQSRTEVQDFLAKTPQARCIIEHQQGLTAARCLAIKSTSAPIMVFFDDDNEPSPNYLQVLSQHFDQYPDVGIWGPGIITVEYLEPVDTWFQQHPEKFQQRQSPFAFSAEKAVWKKCYPNGTGFALRRDILDLYVSKIENGTLNLTGRNGQSLTSAEDVQIVWEGIKLGYAAGMIPDLCCNHLIPASKANIPYLKRLSFGAASSYMPALFQSFPEESKSHNPLTLTIQIYIDIFIFLIKMAINPQQKPELQLQMAEYMGIVYGLACAINSPRSDKLMELARQLHCL
jgi:glycosyltransferase involved in cell wall biosynthesis